MPPILDSHDNWQVLIALLWPHLLEAIKNAPFIKCLSQQTGRWNFWLTGVVAFFTTLGVHANGSWTAGWTIMIPPIAVVAHSLIMWLSSHLQYQFVYKDPQLQKAILAELKQLNAPKP